MKNESKNSIVSFDMFDLEQDDAFTNVLYGHFLVELKEQPKNPKYKLLLSKIGDGRDSLFLFDKLFDEGVELNFEFAKQLNLYDIVSSDCLSAKTKEGEAILYLCNALSVNFIVGARHWNAVNNLFFCFYVSFSDDPYSLQHELSGNTLGR